MYLSRFWLFICLFFVHHTSFYESSTMVDTGKTILFQSQNSIISVYYFWAVNYNFITESTSHLFNFVWLRCKNVAFLFCIHNKPAVYFHQNAPTLTRGTWKDWNLQNLNFQTGLKTFVHPPFLFLFLFTYSLVYAKPPSCWQVDLNGVYWCGPKPW